MLKLSPGQRMAIRAAVRASERRRNLFRSANLGYNYRPFRGLLFSLLVHAFVLFGLLLFDISNRVSEQYRYLARAVIIDHNRMVLYLPPLGDTAHKREPEPGSKPHDKSARTASARRTQGLSYPGPQTILTDFEKPTNRIQTVSQPGILNPSILKPPLLLPNIVHVADAGPAPELKVSDPIFQPAVKLAPALPLELQERVQPPAIASDIARVAETKSPEPSQKPPEPTKPVEQLKVDPPKLNSPIPVTGPDLRNFLALTPMPAVAEPAFSPPPGEARGRFAISPDPNLAGSEMEAGSKGTTAAPASPPAGSGLAAGSGTSSSPGKNVFPGITIIGGTVDNRMAGNPSSNARTSLPLQTSYGITVLSASSGGGLPNLGVFSSEQVYTAFLDMRDDRSDRAPSWTVEYALLQPIPSQVNGASKRGRGEQGDVLPFPAIKEQPAMPAELVRRYPRQLVIVYAIINIEGKIEQMVVKDSPDARLNEPVLKALGKWVFRPAQRDGEIVPAKVLLGIPVWAPPVP